MPFRGSKQDKYPQLLTVTSTAQTAADAAVSVTIPTPIPRFGSSARPWVFEILSIEVVPTIPTVAVPARNILEAQLSTVAPTGITPNDTRVFWNYRLDINCVTDQTWQTSTPYLIDYASGGRGLLIATDNIYLYFDTTGTGAATNSVTLKILYRLITVPLTEFIGIVQSQQ